MDIPDGLGCGVASAVDSTPLETVLGTNEEDIDSAGSDTSGKTPDQQKKEVSGKKETQGWFRHKRHKLSNVHSEWHCELWPCVYVLWRSAGQGQVA